MESKLTSKRKQTYLLLIFATFFMYIILTAAKNIYVAEKTTFHAIGTFGSLTDLAATMEYYFYSYAATQILLIFFIKKLNVKWYLGLTVAASAVLTVLMAFTNTITQHWIIYIVNGVLQAGIWSCSMKVLTSYLPGSMLPFSNKLMSSGPAVSGVISYGVSAMFGDVWRVPFVLLGGILLVAVALFFICVTKASHYPREVIMHHVVHADGTEEDVTDEEGNDFVHLKSKKRIVAFYVVSVIVSLLVTGLFFFLYNNLDLFLKQIGEFSNTNSKLITIIAPIVIVLGPFMTVSACEKQKSFLLVCAVMFSVSALFLALLMLLFKVNIILSLLLFVGFAIFANGGRMIPLSIAPLRMRDKIDAGVYSAVVNAAASIASGVAPKLLARIVDTEGRTAEENWQIAFNTSCITVAAILAIMALLLFTVKILNKKDAREESPVVLDETVQ